MQTVKTRLWETLWNKQLGFFNNQQEKEKEMEVEAINYETAGTKPITMRVNYLDLIQTKQLKNDYWTFRNMNTDWTFNYKELLLTQV